MLWAEKFMSTSRPKGTGTAVPSCRLRTTATASLLARHAGLGSAVADNRIVTAAPWRWNTADNNWFLEGDLAWTRYQGG